MQDSHSLYQSRRRHIHHVQCHEVGLHCVSSVNTAVALLAFNAPVHVPSRLNLCSRQRERSFPNSSAETDHWLDRDTIARSYFPASPTTGPEGKSTVITYAGSLACFSSTAVMTNHTSHNPFGVGGKSCLMALCAALRL